MPVATNKKVEDMTYFELLAWLGIGSSHPGGFPATLQNLELLQVKPDENVLDAGCGSGLTACYLAKKYGCKITGVDINPDMIAKARLRADKEGVTHLVEFKVADVLKLPFASNRFDLVVGESITVFLDKVKVYREFYRVLKPGGRVGDLEMALLKELPDQLKAQMLQCFGAGTDPLSFAAWLSTIQQAGFADCEIKNAQCLKNKSNLLLHELKKDWLLIKELTEKATSQPGLLARLQKNSAFMKKNLGYFGFGMIHGTKPLSQRTGFRAWVQQILSRRVPDNNAKQ